MKQVTFRLTSAAVAMAFCLGASAARAQAPAPSSTPKTQEAPPSAQAPEKKPEAKRDPMAPEPAPPLPAGMTGSNTDDPRYKLSPGLFNAGETSMGMKHLLLLKKPDAFQLGASSPDDPKVKTTLGQLGVGDPSKMPKPVQMVVAQLAFSNSDLAFEGNHLFQGNFYGVNIYDISNPAKAKLLTSMVCPGGQGDVSVYKNLMFMSVEMPNGRIDCGTQGFPPDPPLSKEEQEKLEKEHQRRPPSPQKDRFRGVRIFDISDIRHPKQIADLQTCRGSHTHTLLVDPNDPNNVYIYVSGISFVRQPEELAGCSDESPDKNANTSLFSIDVIKVPLAHPEQAQIVSHPRVFMDARTGAINGLTNGGTHGDKEGEKPRETDQCHDITVYSAIGLAAGACSGNGLILDIKDPVNPKRVDAVNDPNYSYWHSASFSNDGSKVVFTDEWGGGMGARCRPNDPNVWGADAIFRLNNDQLKFESYYKMPAAQQDTENCVAHNGSLIPVPGRDILVQAWYQGGISVMDFTDPSHPQEIAYFDRGPIDPKMLVLGGDWSAYWYNGYIYGSEIARGLDVFELTPSKYLSQNEINAAKAVKMSLENVQNQQKIVWPANLTVAKAYLDQLRRSQALSNKELAEIEKAVNNAEKSHLGKKQMEKLEKLARSVNENAGSAKTLADAKRLHALAQILEHPAA